MLILILPTTEAADTAEQRQRLWRIRKGMSTHDDSMLILR
ncbi:hypothetical protein ADINL_0347 [Nitrincola lacisaponensis]|uniref:Uncharacterized protein n=1 Tax=Nitrincola lacisaponensis TaxID=267850 RepID=A0A063Y6D6_9GAMM|nr:hypothetical protein ADINL_0347 [Nitrincola lacisaponensis]